MMRILVAGIGNIFFGDDAFGGAVVEELLREPVPAGVQIRDFGIRTYDLAYALMDGYDEVIFIDATSRGEVPGTLYLLKPNADVESENLIGDGHSINARSVLQVAQALGAPRLQPYLVGCEPDVLESEEIGLSVRVQAAVPYALQMVKELIGELLARGIVGERTSNLP